MEKLTLWLCKILIYINLIEIDPLCIKIYENTLKCMFNKNWKKEIWFIFPYSQNESSKLGPCEGSMLAYPSKNLYNF